MNRPYISAINIIIIVILLTIAPGASQISTLQHESNLEWQTARTPHFLIHFPSGFERLAYRIGNICEDIYEPVSRTLNFFPGPTHVVVHTRADLADGVTSFLPWRMELFVMEPQGNMFGSNESWLRMLIVHEFTHIVHLRKRSGISSLTYPFLGDYNSFWQQIVPNWFTEGIATLNETRLTSGGRGRTPFHWMQMAAPIWAEDPWPLVNTNYRSRKHLPQNNMRYVSGYYLTQFIQHHYGIGIWRRVLDRYSAFPLLGFNNAIKSVTGKGINKSYQELQKEIESTLPDLDSYELRTEAWRETEIPEDQYSPRWLDNDNIVIYRKSLDDLPELTSINRSGKSTRILQRRLSRKDNSFSLGENVIIWTEMHPHPRFTATIYSDLKIYIRGSEETKYLTRNARIYCPDLSPDETQVIAVQAALPTTRLVILDLISGEISPVLHIPTATIWNPRWSPNGKSVTFAVKDSSGKQDIALLSVETGQWRYLYPSDTYHDNNPCWTPDGEYILYTSDRSGIFNIWAVKVSTGKRWLVTRSGLGAFSPDVSPNGKEIAFSNYTPKGFIVMTTPLDPNIWIEEQAVKPYVNPFIFNFNYSINKLINNHHDISFNVQSYSPWKQILQPQGWIPYPVTDEKGASLGLFVMSQDVLHRHSWAAYFSPSRESAHPIFDFRYTYRRWWPVFGARLFDIPEMSVNGKNSVWQRKKGLDISLSLPLILEKNVYTTVAQPMIQMRYQRWNPSTEYFSTATTLYCGIQAGFNLGRTGFAPRDIVPRRAYFVSFFGDWTSPKLGSDFEGKQLSTQLVVYRPTRLPHHQIEFFSKYQWRDGGFAYDFYGALPIGYSDDQKNHQLRLKMAYILPLAYLELPVPFLPVWVEYLDAAAFYDWGTSWNTDEFSDHFAETARYSTGIQVTSVNTMLQYIRLRLGIAVFYHSDDRNWRTKAIIGFPF